MQTTAMLIQRARSWCDADHCRRHRLRTVYSWRRLPACAVQRAFRRWSFRGS